MNSSVLQNDVLSLGKLFNILFSADQANCIEVTDMFTFAKEYYTSMPRFYKINISESVQTLAGLNCSGEDVESVDMKLKIFRMIIENCFFVKVVNTKNTVNNMINLPRANTSSSPCVEEQIYCFLKKAWSVYASEQVHQDFGSLYTTCEQFLAQRPSYSIIVDDVYLTLSRCEKIGNFDRELEMLLEYLETEQSFDRRVELAKQFLELIYFLIVYCGFYVNNLDASILFVEKRSNTLCLLNYENLISFSHVKFSIDSSLTLNHPLNTSAALIENKAKRYRSTYINTTHIISQMTQCAQQEDANMKDVVSLPSQDSHAQQTFTEDYIHTVRRRKTQALSEKNLISIEESSLFLAHGVKSGKNKRMKKEKTMRLNAVDKKLLSSPFFVTPNRDRVYNPSHSFLTSQDTINREFYAQEMFNFLIYSSQILLFILLPNKPSELIKYFKKYHLGYCNLKRNSQSKPVSRCHFNKLTFNKVLFAGYKDGEKFEVLLHQYFCQNFWKELHFQHLSELSIQVDVKNIKRVFSEYIFSMQEFVKKCTLL